MAFKSGRSAVISVNSQDLSAYCQQVDFNTAAGTGDTTTFGATWQTNLATLLSAGATLNGYYDPTASTGPAAVLSSAITGLAAVPVVYKPGGAVTGQQTVSFSANLTNYQESGVVGGIITFSCQVQATGAVTFGTVP